MLIWLHSLIVWCWAVQFCCVGLAGLVWVLVFADWLCGWVGGLLAVCLVGLAVSGCCLIVLDSWYVAPIWVGFCCLIWLGFLVVCGCWLWC